MAAVLALGVAPSTPAAVEPSAREAIAALLEQRSRAVRERDEAAFMGTVSRLDPSFRSRQRAAFRSMENVPLSDYRLDAAWSRMGDLARPSDRARYPQADEISIPVTEERYSIAGYDESPAVEDLYLTYVLEDGAWRIASDTDMADLTLFSVRHPWDNGEIERFRRGPFLVLQHPCSGRYGGSCDGFGDRIASAALSGLERVRRYWRVPWSEKVVIAIPGNVEELERMIQSTFDVDSFVAFAYSTVDLSRGIDYVGHRILPNPRAFSGRPESQVEAILAHELLHVATRGEAGPFIPIWVDEGFADHVGYDADPSSLSFFAGEVAAGLFDGRLPEDYEFTIGSTTEIFRSYQEGQSAVRFFILRWGLDRFVRFYRVLGRVEVAPGTVPFHVDRALRRTIGIGLDDFERAWAASIAGS